MTEVAQTVTLSEDVRTFRRSSPNSKLLSIHKQLWLRAGSTYKLGPVQTMSFDHRDQEAAGLVSIFSSGEFFVLMSEIEAAIKK